MSGGPVFSQAGHVVGLVSTSIEAAGVSSATFFSGWDIPQRIFGSVDPDNPGRFRSYCAFSEGQPMFCSQSIEAVQAYAAEHRLTDLGMASVDPVTGDYLRLDS